MLASAWLIVQIPKPIASKGVQHRRQGLQYVVMRWKDILRRYVSSV